MRVIAASTWLGSLVAMRHHNRDITRQSTADRDISRMIPPSPYGTVEDMATTEADRLRSALSTFFDRIKRERKISRSRLCQMAKVSESTVRAFLTKGPRQTQTMQHDTLERLARAAGVTMDQMLGTAPISAIQPAMPIDQDRMHALLIGIGTLLEREAVKLGPRQFADLAMAIYGIAAQDQSKPFVMSPEIERLVLLYARGR